MSGEVEEEAGDPEARRGVDPPIVQRFRFLGVAFQSGLREGSDEATLVERGGRTEGMSGLGVDWTLSLVVLERFVVDDCGTNSSSFQSASSGPLSRRKSASSEVSTLSPERGSSLLDVEASDELRSSFLLFLLWIVAAELFLLATNSFEVCALTVRGVEGVVTRPPFGTSRTIEPLGTEPRRGKEVEVGEDEDEDENVLVDVRCNGGGRWRRDEVEE